MTHHLFVTKKRVLMLVLLLSCLAMAVLVFLFTKNKPPVKITLISKNLSHRVLALDAVETRLNLMVGFTVSGNLPQKPEEISALGRLSFNGVDVSSCRIPHLDHFGGNLNFYLPFVIEPGDYDLFIIIERRVSGEKITAEKFTVENIETLSHRETNTELNWMHPPEIPLQNPKEEMLGASIKPADRTHGYLLWQRNPFTYVYPNSAPQQSEIIEDLSATLAQNEYEPLTFSLYALEDLGGVVIDISKLSGAGGFLFPAPQIYVVETVPRIKDRNKPEDGYEMRPRLLQKGNNKTLKAGRSQRFWLTFHAKSHTPVGLYKGTITITTDLGRNEVPVSLHVLPFSLQERPDREYGFLMTYEFLEMTARDLSLEEKDKIYQNGLKYYRSFKEHGLTAIIPHSSFTFQRLDDGSPDLRDLQAALKAFTKVGFTGPFIYYCGHLIQSSKPGWAGSSLGYDADYHPELMKEIVSYARNNFAGINDVDFYWLPVDEAQDDRVGPDRTEIARQLLGVLRDMKEKTAITDWEDMQWAVDIKFGDPPPVTGGAHWYYPNGLTTVPASVDDAAAIRRAFGLAFLSTNYIGIAPWTFQTSENAAANPYTDLDNALRAEVMVAYPGIDGPISTPEYEAVREGIDDGRYSYILETLIKKATLAASAPVRELGLQAEKAHRILLHNASKANVSEMDAARKIMIKWILQLNGSDLAVPDHVSN